MRDQPATITAPAEVRRIARLFPSFRDFVDDALFHPAWGYYSTGKVRFGEGGHYDTFPLALVADLRPHAGGVRLPFLAARRPAERVRDLRVGRRQRAALSRCPDLVDRTGAARAVVELAQPRLSVPHHRAQPGADRAPARADRCAVGQGDVDARRPDAAPGRRCTLRVGGHRVRQRGARLLVASQGRAAQRWDTGCGVCHPTAQARHAGAARAAASRPGHQWRRTSHTAPRVGQGAGG